MEEIKIQLPRLILRNFEDLVKQKNITTNIGIEGAMSIYLAIHLLEPKKVEALLLSLFKEVDKAKPRKSGH